MAKDRSVYWADVHTKVIEYLGKPALQLCIVDISERQACGGGPQAFGKGKNNPESDCQCLSYHLGRSDVRGRSGRCPSVMKSEFGIFGYIRGKRGPCHSQFNQGDLG